MCVNKFVLLLNRFMFMKNINILSLMMIIVFKSIYGFLQFFSITKNQFQWKMQGKFVFLKLILSNDMYFVGIMTIFFVVYFFAL